MSKSSKPLHYWDSCTFLALLKNEADKIDECRSVIKAAEAGKVIIVTSTLTFIEVVRLEKRKPKLPKEHEEKIRAFFKHEWIYICELDRKIAELARELMWQYESLRPKDSTHVATAIYYNVDVLDTFDEGLIKLSGQIGEHPLIIQKPFLPTQLDLFDSM
ncbi:type II toxin-antitoxin system VapC family toxin [Microcoleus sp. FACHB-68]|uniref:type II toxin-antitoxin system VapC family toxin n=1 Tax=Microcoleus sp. FACHB-68 TaxID=2692826 RepID=UPI001682ACBD|nr:type II toxin-antitoxin system VapC family toxin [Microcoleus sp. FACHB-68]MBD1939732.1 type II toxin-antitoxin system VapC family toxin [Microcoleus sp. FACHB-68]